MSVNIFAPGKEAAKELEFVACLARAGDDTLDLGPFVERFAGILPFIEHCVADVRAIAADDDLLSWVGDMVNDSVEFELR